MRLLKRVCALLAIGCVSFLIFMSLFYLLSPEKPSNDHNFTLDQQVLSTAKIEGHTITIKDIRNFTYRTTTDYTPAYYDKTFDLKNLESVWYIVEPFKGYGFAHTFLSFGFKGGEYVSISVEIRKEKGEKFSPWKGLFNNYELMYVIADERDV